MLDLIANTVERLNWKPLDIAYHLKVWFTKYFHKKINDFWRKDRT